MRVDHYQELMDRGWRRSGTTYYKPDLLRSCCPHYTIRLQAKDFRARRDQRSAINKLNSFVLGPEYNRKIAMSYPQSRAVKRQKRNVFDVLDAAHRAVYDQMPRPVDKKSEGRIEPAHKLEVALEADTCTKEKHKVMLRYQTQIHNDPASRWTEPSFKRFLCNGLHRKIVKCEGKTMKLGSYHQCYRLDGKLVAVGVLDLLPHAVSSVYLFYDPDYHEWDWGKISALHEVALTLEKGYEYYYMGYYIHSCAKMRYKGRYGPSSILDPEALTWHPLEDSFRIALDERRYVSRSADEAAVASNAYVPGSVVLFSNGVNPKYEAAQGAQNEKLEKEDIEVDDDKSEDDDTDIQEGSLFDYNIPGVLSKEEVAKLDLGKVKLLVRTSLIDLEDLRGWEEWQIDDPATIKGITAELIAATGPKLLHDSVLSLF